MILRYFLAVLLFLKASSAEFCGSNKIPYGLEVHKSGQLTLLCSRPACHEKKYAECPERAESDSCPENSTWVGGLERRVDGSVQLMCCDYELMNKYAEVAYKNITLRRGEYFEAEEKLDVKGEEVISFDLITNIQNGIDKEGEYFSLTVHRYHCGRIPDTPPIWARAKHWPYWSEEKEV